MQALVNKGTSNHYKNYIQIKNLEISIMESGWGFGLELPQNK